MADSPHQRSKHNVGAGSTSASASAIYLPSPLMLLWDIIVPSRPPSLMLVVAKLKKWGSKTLRWQANHAEFVLTAKR